MIGSFLLTIGSLSHYLTRAFQMPYLYFTVLAVGFLCIVFFFFFKRLGLLVGQLKRKWNPPSPFDPRLLQYYRNAVVFWSFLLFIAIVAVSFALYLASYQMLGTKVQIAGQVLHHGNLVQFISSEGIETRAVVKGSQIAAAGLFIRFPNWMSWIGLGNYHKLVTFRGNFENEYHYGKKPPTLWLRSYLRDPLLIFWYKNAHHVGFAEPAYIESVYFSGPKHRLLVTHSGYIVQ